MRVSSNANYRRVCEKLIIRICQSVNPKTVEEYVLHRRITVKEQIEEEKRGRGGGGCE
jgi:hypothetical protein